MSTVARPMTAFERVGTADESAQVFFPGEHCTRPVLDDYTNSRYMELFSDGQDLGGSSGGLLLPVGGIWVTVHLPILF
ncbi:hypothetical protein [Bacteroides sp.]